MPRKLDANEIASVMYEPKPEVRLAPVDDVALETPMPLPKYIAVRNNRSYEVFETSDEAIAYLKELHGGRWYRITYHLHNGDWLPQSEPQGDITWNPPSSL